MMEYDMQKFVSPIICSIILALWVSGIAILSVQNATPISLKIFFKIFSLTIFDFESIQIPIGVILSLSVSMGVIIGSALLSPFFSIGHMKDSQEDF